MSPEPAKHTMLVAYDGSDQARLALQYAAKLLRPTHVEILTAWEPLHRQAARAVSMSGLRQAEWAANSEEDDPAYAEARRILREGVELAEALGLQARAHMVETATAIWSAIVDAAKELRPDVIVTGTRAVTGIKSLWQSSTAESLVTHAGIPVFIVPPPSEEDDELAEAAAAEQRALEDAAQRAAEESSADDLRPDRDLA